MFPFARAHRMFFTLLLGLLLLPAALLHAGGATAIGTFAPAAPTPDPNSPFGVAGVMRWPDWGTFSQPADAMLQTGGSWVREDFAWGLIEPRENSWDWTATDRIVQTLRARSLNVLGIISYSANWATPSHDDDKASSAVSMYPPDSSKYYWFVHALVEHYKGSVHYWEVWNEPDNSLFWKPAPNAHEYADLLKAAYKAVKDVDPSAQVLSGGLSGNAIPYLEEVMQYGAGNSFDILALHPYAVPLNQDQAKVESRPEVHKLVDVELNKYKAFLQRHGWKRPIWVTEIGWPAHSWQLDESAQADYLAQAYAQMLASGIPDRIFWYSFKDESAAGADSWGLTAWGAGKTDLAPRRPAFAAYATSARMLAGTHAVGRAPIASYTVVDGLKQAGEWTRSFNDQGAFHITSDQHHSSTSSGELKYSFTGPNQAVDFAPPKPISIAGSPTRLGLWVLGDASGDYLSAWLKDREGELFKVRLGAITGATDGWRYYESSLQSYYFGWEHAGGSPSNGVVDYPVQFVGFRLENTPDEPAGSGTIYVDDLQSTGAPDVSAVRFSRDDGQVVDVLWSVAATQVNLPSQSAQAQVIARDGAVQTVTAAGGAISLKVGSSPIYVVHRAVNAQNLLATPGSVAVATSPPAPAATPQPPSAGCLASLKSASHLPDGIYFEQTGHNLGGAFRAYWETHGGVGVLGFPVTEEFTSNLPDGKAYRQQIFQRARMEYHPENTPPNDVQLGLLGVWISQGRNFSRVPTPGNSFTTYFAQTGHTLDTFKEWWTAHGGVGVFGYPLSEEMQEKNAADGKVYTVQYFERNRLEAHPEYAGNDNSVLLGLLGTEYLSAQGCAR